MQFSFINHTLAYKFSHIIRVNSDGKNDKLEQENTAGKQICMP